MRDKEYRLSQTKYKLRNLKERKVRFVIWRLTRQQKEYIQGLGYEVIPYLYEVQTKQFRNISSINNSKLKELHYSFKRGKKAIVMKLNKQDMNIFDEYSVKFRPIKYKIRVS